MQPPPAHTANLDDVLSDLRHKDGWSANIRDSKDGIGCAERQRVIRCNKNAIPVFFRGPLHVDHPSTASQATAPLQNLPHRRRLSRSRPDREHLMRSNLGRKQLDVVADKYLGE